MSYGMKLHPDVTGCVHDVRLTMGKRRCSRCARSFDVIETDGGPRLKAREDGVRS